MSSLNGLLSAFAPPTPPIVQWQGASGRWYAHSVFSLYSIPDWIEACNYIFSAPRPDGLRSPLYVGESGEFDVRLGQHEKLPDVLRLGGTELHVHLGAATRQQRLDIETDLRRGQPAPLNRQGLGGIRADGGFGGGILGALGADSSPANALGLAGYNPLLGALGTRR
jgi:hypothetical protein